MFCWKYRTYLQTFHASQLDGVPAQRSAGKDGQCAECVLVQCSAVHTAVRKTYAKDGQYAEWDHCAASRGSSGRLHAGIVMPVMLPWSKS